MDGEIPEMYEKVMINRLWDEGQDIQMKFIELRNAEKGVDTIMEDVYNLLNGKAGPSQGLGNEVV